MRVSQMTFYRTSSAQLMRIQTELSKLNNQVATGNIISKPSDAPVSSITVQSAKIQMQELDQYATDLEHAKSWLSQATSDFSQLDLLIQQALTLAEQMATGTMDSSNRQVAAQKVQGLIGDIILVCNNQISGSHIYAGTRTDQAAVSNSLKVDSIATPASGNTGTGNVYAFGDYSGLMSRDITITADATVANRFQISYVDDFGRQRTNTVDLAGEGVGNAVEICDGVMIYIDSGSFTPGESYTLGVGRQQGNTSDILVNLSTDNRMDYNYTVDQFLGAEGNSGDGWTNLLDVLSQWSYYLERDGQDHDYYEAMPGVGNDPTNSGAFQVSGDWDTLSARQYEFNVGGPITSNADAADRAHFSNFTIDASWGGGVPSADNPMIINYEYDGAYGGMPAGTYQVTITDVGADASFALVEGGVEISLADCAYENTGQTWQITSSFQDGQTPSPSNPMEVTYTYLDDSGVRRMGTLTFDGTGSTNAANLEPSGSGVSLTLSENGAFDLGDRFDLTLEQYNQGQTKSQEMLETLKASLTTVLKCEADAGAKLNRLEVRYSFFEEDVLRLNDRLQALNGVDIATVTAEWQLQKIMYQAALQATAMVSSTSLADYI